MPTNTAKAHVALFQQIKSVAVNVAVCRKRGDTVTAVVEQLSGNALHQ